MSDNITKTEALPEESKALPNSEPEKTISVDIYGEQIEMPLSKAKAIIAKRDTKTKEYNELKTKITTAESQAKAEAEKSALLLAMKNQDAAAVEDQVSAKYKDTISRFEKKVYGSAIEVTLSKLGVLTDALSDASKLVLADAKPELDGDDIKLNGVKIDDYLKEWTSKKQHLVSVKAGNPAGKTGAKGFVPEKPKADVNANLAKGMANFLKGS